MCVCVLNACMYVRMGAGGCAAAAGPVERVYLSAPIVAIRGKEANLTAVVWPSHSRTLTFFWWFDNSSEVRSFSSSHYCPHSFCPVCCSLLRPLDILVLLFTKRKSTELSHKSCKMRLRVTGLCLPGGFKMMARGIYLSCSLCILQQTLIIQYVKTCV